MLVSGSLKRQTKHMQQSPIFTKTFDFLTWLLPVTNSFPKAQRFSVTQRLLSAAFDLREALEEANLRRGAARRQKLQDADVALAKVRLYLRLAVHWQWLSLGQYKHVSRMTTEIGRLLGGWQKATA
ncbi:MAG: diversity-generating retroelement protein Avd [Chloroflexota bacterium]